MLKQSLVDSCSFLKNNFIAMSLIILPIVVPVDTLMSLYAHFLEGVKSSPIERLIPLVIGFITYPIYTIGTVFYMASVISDEPIDTKNAWKLGTKFWWPYVIMSIYVSLIIIFGSLLIIPGIIFAARYTFSGFDLLLNQSKPSKAMKNSWNSTKGYTWVILGGYVVITLVLYIPYYLIVSFLGGINTSHWILITVLNSAYSVFTVLYTIFAFRVYQFTESQRNPSLNQATS